MVPFRAKLIKICSDLSKFWWTIRSIAGRVHKYNTRNVILRRDKRIFGFSGLKSVESEPCCIIQLVGELAESTKYVVKYLIYHRRRRRGCTGAGYVPFCQLLRLL